MTKHNKEVVLQCIADVYIHAQQETKPNRPDSNNKLSILHRAAELEQAKTSSSSSSATSLNGHGESGEPASKKARIYQVAEQTPDSSVKKSAASDSSVLTPAKGKWTEEEHSAFVDAMERYPKHWKQIAVCVRTRTATQCRTHAQKVIKGLYNTGVYKTRQPPGLAMFSPALSERHGNHNATYAQSAASAAKVDEECTAVQDI